MTFDSPAPGLRIAQPERAFRYTSDAIWLAGFALEVAPGARSALDLGTGSGVVALLLASHGIPVVGIDVRPEWAPLWQETLAGCRLPVSVELRQADVSEPIDARFDLVVSNPPYFPAGTGPVAPDPWRRAARTESTATLGTFVARGLAACEPGGRFCVVIPREREDDVLVARGAHRVEHRVRVGRRRTLLCLGPGETGPIVEVDEGSARVRGWLALAGAGVDPDRARSY